MAYGDIIRRFDRAPNTVIMEDTDEVKIICFRVENKDYSFNAEWIPEEIQEWFAIVLERQFWECYAAGRADEHKRLSRAYKDFLDAIK